jgi:hypothetical protein
LNGIFGNLDLMFCYLQTIETILQEEKTKQKQETHASSNAPFLDNDNMDSLVSLILECSKSVLSFAEHQKCMTDDVVQLSRLQTHSLTITPVYYHPHELLQTIAHAFRAQAESKVQLTYIFLLLFLSFFFPWFLVFRF